MILLANRFYPALALNQTWQLSSWFRFCGPSALLRADVHEKVAIDTACGCFCGEIGQGEGAHGTTALPDVFSLQVDSCGWEDCHGIFHRSAESPLRFELGRGLISIVYVESLKSWCMLAEVACWKMACVCFWLASLCIMCGCSRNSLLLSWFWDFRFELIDLVLGFCLLIEVAPLYPLEYEYLYLKL